LRNGSFLAFPLALPTREHEGALQMLFLVEQHLVAAKLVRKNGAARIGAERELFIRKSNSCVVCVSLMAKDRGGICLNNFDWWSLTPDWSVVDEQVRRLAPPHIDSPRLVPDD
jgi:hypothetical protein